MGAFAAYFLRNVRLTAGIFLSHTANIRFTQKCKSLTQIPKTLLNNEIVLLLMSFVIQKVNKLFQINTCVNLKEKKNQLLVSCLLKSHKSPSSSDL